jgi:hypothetical protein
MRLPNVDEAFIPEEKITLYLLNSEHPKGRGKAKFFIQFGFSMAQWKRLAEALLSHAQSYDVVKIEETLFGIRYVVEGELETPIKRYPKVRVVWFISINRHQPYLVTAYPLEGDYD